MSVFVRAERERSRPRLPVDERRRAHLGHPGTVVSGSLEGSRFRGRLCGWCRKRGVPLRACVRDIPEQELLCLFSSPRTRTIERVRHPGVVFILDRHADADCMRSQPNLKASATSTYELSAPS